MKNIKKILSIALCLMLIFCLTACAKDEYNEKELLKGKYTAVIEVSGMGKITLILDADIAPITVTNFKNLADSGFYDGLTFHRVIKGFMIQGGDPNGDGTGGSAVEITGEFTANGIENNISHKRGVIAMARSNDMNSASSQFFIVHEDSLHLDGQYAAFGHVIDGMDIVDKIANNTPIIDSNGTVANGKKPIIKTITVKKASKSDIKNTATANTPDDAEDTELLKGKHTAVIGVKDMGEITLTLDADIAPITVTNFKKLADEGFYNGLTFHRIINGFMIQGGDPNGDGTGGSAVKIKGEFAANGIKNSISHKRGVISMARSNDMNSASSQFFIVHEDSLRLDGQYAAFGYVQEGMDIVDKIAKETPVVDSNGTTLKQNQPIIEYIKMN